MKRSTLVALIAGGVAVLLLINLAIYVKVLKPAMAVRSSVIIQGPAMEPTFKEGDIVRTQAPKGDLKRGDVVIVADPTDPKRQLVKRIVAVGGDTVEMRKGVLHLNGQAVAEPYANPNWKGDVALVKVPVGQLYLLGDNRGMSFDSRQLGPVPVANVKSVVIAGK